MNAKVHVKFEDGDAVEVLANVDWFKHTNAMVIVFRPIDLVSHQPKLVKKMTIKILSGSTQETDGAAASTPNSSSEST